MMKPLSLCFRSSTLRPQTYMTGRTCHAASTAYMHSGLCLALWVWFDNKDPALAALQFDQLDSCWGSFSKSIKAWSAQHMAWLLKKAPTMGLWQFEVSSGTEYVVICFDCTLRCKGCWCLQSQQGRWMMLGSVITLLKKTHTHAAALPQKCALL